MDENVSGPAAQKELRDGGASPWPIPALDDDGWGQILMEIRVERTWRKGCLCRGELRLSKADHYSVRIMSFPGLTGESIAPASQNGTGCAMDSRFRGNDKKSVWPGNIERSKCPG